VESAPAIAVRTPKLFIPTSFNIRVTALRKSTEGPVKVAGARGRKVQLPRPLVGLLEEILKNMQAGKAVSIVPEHHELTTQRAANMLGVSRPFMVRLLEEDKLPFHMVGSHRRVYLRDVLAYKAKRDKERHTSIVRMARMEKKAGTYDKVVLPPGSEDK
jgi:excisionase family DNA binding protein